MWGPWYKNIYYFTQPAFERIFSLHSCVNVSVAKKQEKMPTSRMIPRSVGGNLNILLGSFIMTHDLVVLA